MRNDPAIDFYDWERDAADYNGASATSGVFTAAEKTEKKASFFGLSQIGQRLKEARLRKNEEESNVKEARKMQQREPWWLVNRPGRENSDQAQEMLEACRATVPQIREPDDREMPDKYKAYWQSLLAHHPNEDDDLQKAIKTSLADAECNINRDPWFHMKRPEGENSGQIRTLEAHRAMVLRMREERDKKGATKNNSYSPSTVHHLLDKADDDDDLQKAIETSLVDVDAYGVQEDEDLAMALKMSLRSEEEILAEQFQTFQRQLMEEARVKLMQHEERRQRVVEEERARQAERFYQREKEAALEYNKSGGLYILLGILGPYFEKLIPLSLTSTIRLYRSSSLLGAAILGWFSFENVRAGSASVRLLLPVCQRAATASETDSLLERLVLCARSLHIRNVKSCPGWSSKSMLGELAHGRYRPCVCGQDRCLPFPEKSQLEELTVETNDTEWLVRLLCNSRLRNTIRLNVIFCLAFPHYSAELEFKHLVTTLGFTRWTFTKM